MLVERQAHGAAGAERRRFDAVVQRQAAVAGAVMVHRVIAQRYLRHDFGGHAVAAVPVVRMRTLAVELVFYAHPAHDLHHVRPDVDAGSDALEAVGPLIQVHVEPRLVHQRGGGRTAQAGAYHGDSSLALHCWYLLPGGPW